MKVWRNAEGREFPANSHDNWTTVAGLGLDKQCMEALGYELVEKEPVNWEVEAQVLDGWFVLKDDALVPGKKYRIVEVVDEP